MITFNSPSVQEAEPHDGLSDRNFFKRFPDATHRARPWRVRDDLVLRPADRLSERVAMEKDWVTVVRRDGFRARMRWDQTPFAFPEIVVLRQPRKGAGMVIDYSPIGFGVRDWS